ncbi:primosomal replication protein PriB/PriC domain protein, partial [Pseudomonas aeruginosa]
MALTAQQMLDKYLEAEAAVLEGRTVIFNGRTHTMEDIEKIRAGRREWERRAA